MIHDSALQLPAGPPNTGGCQVETFKPAVPSYHFHFSSMPSFSPALRAKLRFRPRTTPTSTPTSTPTPTLPKPINRQLAPLRTLQHASIMQAVWSRAARAHGCGCGACFQATRITARLFTTQARPNEVSAVHFFTASSTPAMAMATVVDAGNMPKPWKVLGRRMKGARAHLDRAIKEKDEALKTVELAQTRASKDDLVSRLDRKVDKYRERLRREEERQAKLAVKLAIEGELESRWSGEREKLYPKRMGKRKPSSRHKGKKKSSNRYKGKKKAYSPHRGKRKPSSRYKGKRKPPSRYKGKRKPSSRYIAANAVRDPSRRSSSRLGRRAQPRRTTKVPTRDGFDYYSIRKTQKILVGVIQSFTDFNMQETNSDLSAPSVASGRSVMEALKRIRYPREGRKKERQKENERNLKQLHEGFSLKPVFIRRYDIWPDDFSIGGEDDSTHVPWQVPRSPTEFAKTTAELNQLVDDLLVETYRLIFPDDPAAMRLAFESLDSAWTAIRLLRSEGYPLYQHPELDPPAAVRAIQELNGSIKSIFATWRTTLERQQEREASTGRAPTNARPGWIKFLVAKICYNLLVSSVPPGVHTYSLLLQGFTQVGEHSLADLVLRTFFHLHYLRPTQQTLVSLVRHYQGRRDMNKLYNLINYLSSVDALVGRRRFRPNSSEASSKAYHVEGSSAHAREGSRVPQAKYDEELVAAIIRALVFFGQGPHATLLLAAALRDGLPVGRDMLPLVLKKILYDVDITAAQLLLRCFVDNVHLIAPLLWESPPHLARRIEKVLIMVSQRLRTHSQECALSPASGRILDCRRLAVAMFIADAWRRVRPLDALIRQARKSIAAGSFPLTTKRKGSILGQLFRLKRARILQRRNDTRFRLMARYRVAEGILKRAEGIQRVAVKTLLKVISTRAPPIYREFLLRDSLPFSLRISSYEKMMRTADLYQQLELQVADTLRVRDHLAEELRPFLLSALPENKRMGLAGMSAWEVFEAVRKDRAPEDRARQEEKQPPQPKSSAWDLFYKLFPFLA